MFVHKFTHEWYVWVHAAAFVHNTTPISRADGLAPFRLMYGRDAVMPAEAMLRPPVVIPNDQTAYAPELATGLSQAHKYMSDILQKSYDVGRKSITILEDVLYSLTLVTTSLYIGDHVQKPLVLLQSGFHVGKDRIKLQNAYLIQTTTALNTLTREKYLIQRMSTNLYV